AAPAGCSTDTTLCLGQGRFLIEAIWTKPDGSYGNAHAFPITEDSGAFWFLEPGNVELAVKTLNGCSTNKRYWFFGTGLTNFPVPTPATDTTTNETKSYPNPQGQAFQPIADTDAFTNCPAGAEAVGDPEEPRDDHEAVAQPVIHEDAALGCV